MPYLVGYITPQDYGAVGNGTTDDTAALQSALTAAGTSGTLYIPAATYAISSALTVPSSVVVRGAGVNSTIIKQTSTTANALTAATATAVKISELQVLGPSSGSGIGVSVSGSPTSYLYLRNVRVAHFGSDGINVGDPIISRFDDVVSFSNGGHGFNIGGATAGTGGTSCSFTACYGLSNTQAGFYLNHLQYSNVSGCGSDSNGTGYYLNSCISVTLTGCGAESSLVNTAPYVGNGFVINGGYGNSLISTFVYQNPAISYWVTGSAAKILLSGCSDNTPAVGATNTIQVDSGSAATVISPVTASGTSYSATTQVLNDGSGNLQTYGTATVAGVPVPGGLWLPSDSGFIAAAYDQAGTTNSTLTVSGTVYLTRVVVRAATTINKLLVGVATAASSVTANENFLGLFNSAGTLVASTAAGTLDTMITSSGIVPATLSSPYSAAAGYYWVAFLNNATTPATLSRASGASLSIANGGAVASAYRFAVNGTAQTALPASITPGSNTTAGAFTMWAAVS